jgi:3-hydroxybutyryl-CoA dehydrogenase
MGITTTDPGPFQEVRQIGVIGAGQMGRGIAHVCALAGLEVSVVDINAAALAQVHETIGRDLSRQVARGRITEEDRTAALARITTSAGYGAFADCDLVIEAAVEREDTKREIFRQLTPRFKPGAIIASNTSSLSITKLATATDRPEKFIGMHFMNPVPVMKLVELIRGIATDEPTFGATRDLVARLGKISVAADDYPAFIVNRVLLPMINEAACALHGGVGSVDAIDTAMKLGANHPMGPFELADLIGLDTCLAIMRVLYDGFADSKYRPCPLLVNYVNAGWLGRKTGRGFYDYRGDKPSRHGERRPAAAKIRDGGGYGATG